MAQDHNERIVDQFTRQAAPFSASAEIRNEDFLGRIIDMAQAESSDTVLDVACGPGLLACAFARVARHVTGIDLTPKMLEQARAWQLELGLDNLTWHEGDVQPLPYPDATFSIVSARFAFHHFLDPLSALKEMRRVCRSGGRVVVADSAPPFSTAAAFNRMEQLRDPSHVRALTPEELVDLFAAAGLPAPRVWRDSIQYELESFLARSFPADGDADRIRQIFEESLDSDRLGVSAVRQNGIVRFGLPVMILVSSNEAFDL
jgi:ubiquinone/menaquinone biosynthesis C-methylase UbiE